MLRRNIVRAGFSRTRTDLFFVLRIHADHARTLRAGGIAFHFYQERIQLLQLGAGLGGDVGAGDGRLLLAHEHPQAEIARLFALHLFQLAQADIDPKGGALGAHGAWLLEPYTDLPSSTGLNTESIGEMKATAKFAIENGFQLATHAIGDRGNRETLDVYEEAFRAHPDKTDLRWRIEHAQHLNAADIPRFAKLGVIPAMQPIHCTSDNHFRICQI